MAVGFKVSLPPLRSSDRIEDTAPEENGQNVINVEELPTLFDPYPTDSPE